MLLQHLITSDAKRVALYFCLGITVVFGVFLALGIAVTWAARRMPRTHFPELALAVRNLGAPGGLTRSVVLSLGAGLSLLVTVALANSSLVEELKERLPARSPDYFVLDVSPDDYPAVTALMKQQFPGAVLEEAPMLRGRLVTLGNTPVEEVKAPPEAQWVLNGDRGPPYSVNPPAGSKVVSGKWWPPDYSGEPLVSFESELAGKLGLKIGDTVTVNVLGRNVTARIANLREVKWESLAINFVMVFSPNTLEGAPYNLLVTVSLPDATPLKAEADGMRALAHAYPSITPIRVRDALDAFGVVFAKVMTAIRVAGGVTLLAGALVLAGALATAQRRRILEAVILKTLGATRRRILLAHALEYLLLASVTALFAIGLGTAAAAIIVTQLMNISFSFSAAAVAVALLLATGLVYSAGSRHQLGLSDGDRGRGHRLPLSDAHQDGQGGPRDRIGPSGGDVDGDLGPPALPGSLRPRDGDGCGCRPLARPGLVVLPGIQIVWVSKAFLMRARRGRQHPGAVPCCPRPRRGGKRDRGYRSRLRG